MRYDEVFTSFFNRTTDKNGTPSIELVFAWNNVLYNMTKAEKQELVERFSALGIREHESGDKTNGGDKTSGGAKWWRVEPFEIDRGRDRGVINKNTHKTFYVRDIVMGYRFTVSEDAYKALRSGK